MKRRRKAAGAVAPDDAVPESRDDAPSWWSGGELDAARLRPLAEPVLERVVQAIASDRFPQALLLAGPSGLGRELAAVETAVMLVCGNGALPWRDGSCAGRIRRGIHPDVAAVLPTGAAQIIKIAQIRDIVASAPVRPYEGRSRVWILDGVEAGHLGAEAANAFLKVLEEPPEHVRFVLLAANPSAVLPTIRSRCQQLSLPGPAGIGGRLETGVPPALVLATLAGEDAGADVERARSVLRQALDGEVRELLRLPLLLTSELPSTEIVAAAAVEEAAASPDGDRAAELVRLAGELVEVERRTVGLRLTRDRQLVSCLMRWWRER